MNPPDNDWNALTLVLTPGPDGHHGTLSIGAAQWHVRRWVKAASGAIRAEVSAPDDPAWRAYLERVMGRVEG